MGQLARQNATRILVTHQVHYLEAADWVIVLQDVSERVFGPTDRLGGQL